MDQEKEEDQFPVVLVNRQDGRYVTTLFRHGRHRSHLRLTVVVIRVVCLKSEMVSFVDGGAVAETCHVGSNGGLQLGRKWFMTHTEYKNFASCAIVVNPT